MTHSVAKLQGYSSDSLWWLKSATEGCFPSTYHVESVLDIWVILGLETVAFANMSRRRGLEVKRDDCYLL